MISACTPHRSIHVMSSVLVLFCCLAFLPAWAWGGSFAIGNADGSFETGLSGMTTQGDVRLVANVGVLLPTQGTQAVLLTSEPDGGHTPTDADMSLLRMDQVTLAAIGFHKITCKVECDQYG